LKINHTELDISLLDLVSKQHLVLDLHHTITHLDSEFSLYTFQNKRSANLIPLLDNRMYISLLYWFSSYNILFYTDNLSYNNANHDKLPDPLVQYRLHRAYKLLPLDTKQHNSDLNSVHIILVNTS